MYVMCASDSVHACGYVCVCVSVAVCVFVYVTLLQSEAGVLYILTCMLFSFQKKKTSILVQDISFIFSYVHADFLESLEVVIVFSHCSNVSVIFIAHSHEEKKLEYSGNGFQGVCTYIYILCVCVCVYVCLCMCIFMHVNM